MDEQDRMVSLEQERKTKLRKALLLATLVTLIPAMITLILDYSAIRDSVVSIVMKDRKNLDDIPRLTHSFLIKELANAPTTYSLLERLNQNILRGIIAVGNRDDFESPEGFYVFIVDAEHVLDVFQFKDGFFYGVKSEVMYSDIPSRFKGKNTIWVIEAEKLVQP